MNQLPKYVLITAAKNEAQHVGNTINSVIQQTHLPVRWAIVSDSSTDETDNIIKKNAGNYPLISYLRKEKKSQYSFTSKIDALKMALEHVRQVDFDFIGIIDADITFENNYFEKLFKHINKNPYLGVCGGWIYEYQNEKFVPQKISFDSVAGAVQLFRKQCFEEIGELNFPPMPYGGEDAVLEFTAKMHGWKVQTFQDLTVQHHGIAGQKIDTVIKAKIKEGKRFYYLGYHSLFYTMRSINRIMIPPYLIGSILNLYGFFRAKGTDNVHTSPEMTAFIRKLQMDRLRKLIPIPFFTAKPAKDETQCVE